VSKSYTLIGVYTEEGKAIPGYVYFPIKVTSFTDSLTGAGLSSVTAAPFTRIATAINP
jgi:hypothetical protein